MKKTFLNTLWLVLFSTALMADDQAPQKETENQILQSFTRGDQTDIYAIPLDDDQLEQQQELDSLESKSQKDSPKKQDVKNKA